jgi:hypothetical protein
MSQEKQSFDDDVDMAARQREMSGHSLVPTQPTGGNMAVLAAAQSALANAVVSKLLQASEQGELTNDLLSMLVEATQQQVKLSEQMVALMIEDLERQKQQEQREIAREQREIAEHELWLEAEERKRQHALATSNGRQPPS